MVQARRVKARGVLWPPQTGRRGKQADAKGLLFHAQEENHYHNAAIMAVSNSPSCSTVCSRSVSAALTASHTTSSLGQHILLWFRLGEWMQQHLVSENHPSQRIQPDVCRLCIIFFKSVKCGHLCSVLSYTSFSRVRCAGAGILITLTATNANNQSTQLAGLSISGDRVVCPEACWFVLLGLTLGQKAQHKQQ